VMAHLYAATYGLAALLTAGAGFSLFLLVFFVLVERASLGFKTLLAREVSLYDPYFWFHERHWKFCGHPLMALFAGTPLKNGLTRMLGVKLGRKVFDDGANLYDKTLLQIGDYTNLNQGAIVQAHSLEEGVFKSGCVRIGKGCTIAPGAFVHYGVTMGDNAVLGPNAFS
jgi:non-ribosomal peptide synthetase-like protein